MKALAALCVTAVTVGGMTYDSISIPGSEEVFQLSPSMNSVSISEMQSEVERAAEKPETIDVVMKGNVFMLNGEASPQEAVVQCLIPAVGTFSTSPDKDGNFSLKASILPPMYQGVMTITIQASCEGYYTEFVEYTYKDGGEVTFLMETGRDTDTFSLSGKILDEEGKPLLGAKVILLGEEVFRPTCSGGYFVVHLPNKYEGTLVPMMEGYSFEPDNYVFDSLDKSIQDITFHGRKEAGGTENPEIPSMPEVPSKPEEEVHPESPSTPEEETDQEIPVNPEKPWDTQDNDSQSTGSDVSSSSESPAYEEPRSSEGDRTGGTMDWNTLLLSMADIQEGESLFVDLTSSGWIVPVDFVRLIAGKNVTLVVTFQGQVYVIHGLSWMDPEDTRAFYTLDQILFILQATKINGGISTSGIQEI